MNIIEFSGLPGCGKSTLCAAAADQLKKQYRVYTYADIVRVVANEKRRRIYGLLSGLNPFSRRFRKLLERYAARYEDVSRQALLVLTALYDMTGILGRLSPKAVILLDEGFVQTLTSVPHLQVLQTDSALAELVQYLQKKRRILLIRCDAPDALVVQRLRGRNRGDRFNSIRSDSELLAALHRKRENLSAAARSFPTVLSVAVEDGTDCHECNVRAVCDAVRKAMG